MKSTLQLVTINNNFVLYVFFFNYTVIHINEIIYIHLICIILYAQYNCRNLY